MTKLKLGAIVDDKPIKLTARSCWAGGPDATFLGMVAGKQMGHQP